MSLAKFVAGLPSAWDMAPIYKKGYLIEDVAGEPEVACGKRPMQGAWKLSVSTAQAAYKIEQFPDVFAACGVYTGPRSGGLVIFDVDWNHGQIVKKWGDDLKGPKVTSPKKNAAKYLFHVPEELWETVSSVSHTQSNQEGWEVLWGAQGLICGEYKDGGVYTPSGDFTALPEAPAWLIGAMQDAAAGKREGEEKPKDPRFAQRTLDQKIAIATQCLTVIPNRGRGSRQEWIEIGFMIHDELPNEHGLEIWRKWSQLDEEYADEWNNGEDPCAKAWATFKPGALRFGTLIRWADRLDPKRARFPKGSFSAQAMADLEGGLVGGRPSYEEMIKRALDICDTDDIPRMNYGLHGLAKDCGFQDQSGIEALLIDHINQTEGGEGYVMTERKAVRREYLIPGLLSRPFTYLFYGREGSGKSATAIALMKHVADAVPFKLRNAEVPVEQGSCIYFSADMSESDWEEEFELHEIKNEHLIRFEPSFNLYKRMSFIKKMKKYKPSLIVIDSLSSASGSKAADENKAEFAGPLYWLNSSNGRLWPACSIIVLHHANKSGGARGSTAIGAAVAEVWHIAVPDPDDKKCTLTPDQRLITVLKSRMGRTGEQLIQTQNADFTLSIVEKQKDAERQTRAGSMSDRILMRLRLAQGKWLATTDLAADAVINGGIKPVRKALNRLENRGLVESMEGEVGTRGGKRPKLYRIVGSRGETNGMGGLDQNPCSDSDPQHPTRSGEEAVGRWSDTDSESNTPQAPAEKEWGVAKPSGGEGSASKAPLGGYIENDWDDPDLTRRLQ